MGACNALGRVYLQDVDTSMTAARRTMFMARSVLGRREESRRTHSSLPSYVCLQPDKRQGAGGHPIVARAGTIEPLYLNGNEDEVKVVTIVGGRSTTLVSGSVIRVVAMDENSRLLSA